MVRAGAFVFGALVSSTLGADAQSTTTYILKVATFPGHAFTRSAAEGILALSKGILEERDGDSDIECRTIRFVVPAEPRQTAPVSIGSREEFNALFGHNSVYIVEDIDWCGDNPPRPILGCSAPGGPIVVTRHPAAALLWAHEIGHGQGLEDRRSPRRNVMYYRNGGGRQVDAGQCDAYRTAQVFPLGEAGPGEQPPELSNSDRLLDMQSRARAAATEPEAAPEGAEALPEFLGELWMHGAPVSEILALSAEEVDATRDVLRSDRHELWPNAVLVLGLRGSGEDMALLQQVLDAPVAGDEWVALAKVNVGLAAGYMANLTGFEEPAAALVELLEPDPRYFVGSPSPELDARAMGRNAARGAALVPSLAPYVAEQQQRVERGELDLGVSGRFYEETRSDAAQATEYGLFPSLLVKEQMQQTGSFDPNILTDDFRRSLPGGDR